MIRKATEKDIEPAAAIYEKLHDAEDNGTAVIGWIRGVYPTEQTARDALARGDLFVLEDEGEVRASAIINQTQVDVYVDGNWKYEAPDEDVMVLHTLTVSPDSGHHGYGRQFVAFYEEYALRNGCHTLRIDTNERNAVARSMYAKLGFREAGIVPCTFNGIPGVQLVLLEKKI